jgi:bifunctional ADP-heptose synthase (sugar kinase/adenylyltransferase)
VDTRKKILDAATAHRYAASGNLSRVVAVAAPFDGLAAPPVRRLRHIRQRHPDATLVVVLTGVPEPLLSWQARAELAAGLRDVDFVVVPEQGEWEKTVTALAPQAVYREHAAQEQERAALMARVRERHAV